MYLVNTDAMTIVLRSKILCHGRGTSVQVFEHHGLFGFKILNPTDQAYIWFISASYVDPCFCPQSCINIYAK